MPGIFDMLFHFIFMALGNTQREIPFGSLQMFETGLAVAMLGRSLGGSRVCTEELCPRTTQNGIH